jgi:hypothetical protein
VGTWATPTSTLAAHLRAGGRRKLNAIRRHEAALRRARVIFWYARWRHLRGVQALLAATFDLSQATVSRYLKGIDADAINCPICGMAATEKTSLRDIPKGGFASEVRTHQSVGRPRAIKKLPA